MDDFMGGFFAALGVIFLITIITLGCVLKSKTEREYDKAIDNSQCVLIKGKINGFMVSGFKCGTANYFKTSDGNYIKVDLQ